jgi:hypothetical protein
MALEKTYVYKVSRSGAFLGVLQNVISPFKYALDINSAVAVLQIVVKQSVDQQRDNVDPIEMEDGTVVQTEDGDTLYMERKPEIVGNTNSNALIRNGNDVEVIEFSDDYPTGSTVFKGYISRWKATFGGTDDIGINVLSYGAEFDNYMILSGDTLDVSNTTVGSQFGLSNDKAEERNYCLQSWTVGGGITTLKSLKLKLAAATSAYIGANVVVEIFGNLTDAQNLSAVPLATMNKQVTSTSETLYTMSLSTPITVTPGAQYYARISVDWYGVTILLDNHVYVSYDSAAGYAGGSMYSYDAVLHSWSGVTGDIYLQTYSNAGQTTAAYASQDPSTILRDVLTNYASQGGTISYSALTVLDTSTITSYTFKVNTVLEGIKKLLSLAPANWYFMVDPATNLLTFKQASTTADHTMILGRHIESLDLEASIEELKNIAYFSGGDTGSGSNLYVKTTSAASLAANKPGLAKLSDPNVTAAAVATVINQGFLDENSAEVYITTLVIHANTYDTKLFKVGQTIGFAGFSSFVDNLVLQIVRLEPEADKATLHLGIIPKRASATLEAVNRDLIEQQTLKNPTTPS